MHRRSFLAAAAAAASGIAGCSTSGRQATDSPTPTPGESLARQGFPPTVCSEALDPGGIVAVADPAHGDDWADVVVPERYDPLTDDAVVVGVERGGQARAYPLSVLAVNEVVNGALGGRPLLVTYCPLCNSGMVAERRVDGAATAFGVSGLLWQPPAIRTRASEAANRTFGVTEGDASTAQSVRNEGNLVLYDARTGSYWSQLLARGICGPREGARLPVVESTTATWGRWRDRHPGTDVLLPPPHSGTANPPVQSPSASRIG